VSRFLGRYGEVPHEYELKRVWQIIHIWLVELIENAVLDAASFRRSLSPLLRLSVR